MPRRKGIETVSSTFMICMSLGLKDMPRRKGIETSPLKVVPIATLWSLKDMPRRKGIETGGYSSHCSIAVCKSERHAPS